MQAHGKAIQGDFGNLDMADVLERAAAFEHVVAAGRADITPGLDAVARAGRLQELAGDLTAAARLWRAGDLR